jgi:hypothetical protein
MRKEKEVYASMPRVLLHLEGLIVLIGALIFYAVLDGSWLLFIILFLAPDISFLAYFGGPKTGAFVYNIFHTCIIPFIVFIVALVYDNSVGMHVAIIWFAHIGADRMMGYGLKYPRGFKTSHMKKV